MLTITDAIDYAADHGVSVSDEYFSKEGRSKAMSMDNTYVHIEILQMGKGSKRWQVQNTAGTFNRAGAIVEAVNQVIAQTKALDE